MPRITLQPQGVTFSSEPDQTLLLAARAAGWRLPSSCRNGTCRACLCRAEGGPARHTIEWPGLSAEEKAEGWLLPCVAVAESELVLWQPAARRIEPAAGTA